MALAHPAPAETGTAARAAARAVIQIRQRGARRQAFYREVEGTRRCNWITLPVPAAEKALKRGLLDMGFGHTLPAVSLEDAEAEERRDQMDRREFDNIERGINAERGMPELPYCTPEIWRTPEGCWLAYPRATLATELYEVIKPGAAIGFGYLATVDDFGFLVPVRVHPFAELQR